MSTPPSKPTSGYSPNGKPFCWLSLDALNTIETQCEEPSTAILVYLALARLACRNGSPVIEGVSIPYLARVASVSGTTVERRLPELKRIGVVEITPHFAPTGTPGKTCHIPSTYRLGDPTPAETPPTTTEKGRGVAEIETREGIPIEQVEQIEKKGSVRAAAPRAPRGSASKFEKPTLEAVVAYGTTIGMPANEAASFMDYYTSDGWKVGRNPMCDWKAAVRQWHRKSSKHFSQAKPTWDRNAGTCNDGVKIAYKVE